MINGLDLFSGIGGISLALSPWVKTICYCEIDRYCQSVLLSRMASGQLDVAPIWDEVNTLSGLRVDGVDIITGGFPCQDISSAGLGKGLDGERSGLFFQVVRLVEEIRPAFVFLENVPAIRTRGLDRVIRSFSDLRYDCRWTCVSAAELGAPHLRKRWFFLAHAQYSKTMQRKEIQRIEPNRDNERLETLADAETFGSWERASEKSKQGKQDYAIRNDWWATEPNVDRMAPRIPFRVDRLRGLGNSVVPAQAREAFKRLIGIEG